MMKCSLYIVTYLNEDLLNQTCASVLKAVDHCKDVNFDLNIINNHSKFSCRYPQFKVLHNMTRPDFSKGHLSRNWNECILNGFQSKDHPKCDYLITLQNDVLVKEDAFSNLLKYHKEKNLTFIQAGRGDELCFYTIDAIRAVGLWDEFFCGIGYQEADYFLRQCINNKDNCSINDYRHNRVYNPIVGVDFVDLIQTGCERSDPIHMESKGLSNDLCRSYFRKKWGFDPKKPNPFENINKNWKPMKDTQFPLYPYF